MRFLCLHGRGTNSKIFEMQTAAIRYELADQHTYEFAEGSVPYPLDPDIKKMLASEETAFAFFDDKQLPTVVTAVDNLDEFFELEGPFDGVIAFSQAVSVAATWIIHRIKQGKPTFTCAIFIAAACPALDYDDLKAGQATLLNASVCGEVIDIPTTHVWGTNDDIGIYAKEVSQLCKADMKSVVIHNGTHEVPGAGNKAVVTRVVNMIRRSVTMAGAAA